MKTHHAKIFFGGALLAFGSLCSLQADDHVSGTIIQMSSPPVAAVKRAEAPHTDSVRYDDVSRLDRSEPTAEEHPAQTPPHQEEHSSPPPADLMTSGHDEVASTSPKDDGQHQHDQGPHAATPGDEAKKQIEKDAKEEAALEQQIAQTQGQMQQQAMAMADSAIANAPASSSTAGAAMVSGNSDPVNATNNAPLIPEVNGHHTFDNFVRRSQDLGPDPNDQSHHSMDSLF